MSAKILKFKTKAEREGKKEAQPTPPTHIMDDNAAQALVKGMRGMFTQKQIDEFLAELEEEMNDQDEEENHE